MFIPLFVCVCVCLCVAADVFRLNRVSHEDLGLSVSASYFEIYCSKVFDLLNGKKRLRILEDARSRVQVGASMVVVYICNGF